jgi:hypothetical protein
MERLNEERKFHAQLQGVKFTDNEDKGGDYVAKGEVTQPNTLFGDPDQYKNMSKEERQELTDKMKNDIGGQFNSLPFHNRNLAKPRIPE